MAREDQEDRGWMSQSTLDFGFGPKSTLDFGSKSRSGFRVKIKVGMGGRHGGKERYVSLGGKHIVQDK